MQKNSTRIKIADLGLARELEEETQTYCGTLSYMSPEQRAQKKYDFSVDIWAIGVITYIL